MRTVPASGGDATRQLQRAVDGGGLVQLDAGEYTISEPLRLPAGLVLRGEGRRTVITQTAPVDGLVADGVEAVVVEDLYVQGRRAGGVGIRVRRGGADCVPYLTLSRVTVAEFGGDGVLVESPIVSVLTQVRAVLCGGAGVHLVGVPGGAAGTSVTMVGCFAVECGGPGHHLEDMTYCSMVGCAADKLAVGYRLDRCRGVSLVGCGAEVAGTGVLVDGGGGNAVHGLYGWQVGELVSGSASAVTVLAASSAG